MRWADASESGRRETRRGGQALLVLMLGGARWRRQRARGDTARRRRGLRAAGRSRVCSRERERESVCVCERGRENKGRSMPGQERCRSRLLLCETPVSRLPVSRRTRGRAGRAGAAGAGPKAAWRCPRARGFIVAVASGVLSNNINIIANILIPWAPTLSLAAGRIADFDRRRTVVLADECLVTMGRALVLLRLLAFCLRTATGVPASLDSTRRKKQFSAHLRRLECCVHSRAAASRHSLFPSAQLTCTREPPTSQLSRELATDELNS
jgi:hypothetical protein